MRKYWLYQLSGWFGYSAAGIFINWMGGGALGPLLVAHAALVSCGIGLTHLLRREIRRRRTPDVPLSRLWPALALASVAISVVLAGLVVGVNRLLGNGAWDLVSVAALWWGMLLAAGVWTILYVRFSEKRGQEVREERLQLALRDAQLHALETQINPHFLFNALNSIRALVEIDPARAQEMLTRLANVLRNSLRRGGEHTVPLESELEAVSDYLALETVRFGDRLNCSVETERNAALCRMPPMLLQTLVENAVKHGVGRASGRADLSIRASVESQLLRIVVENTGNLAEPRGAGVRVGLKNTRDRLALLYGDEACLTLEEANGRVVATVEIPAVEHEHESHTGR
ncbi:MAG: sensor histidine kinase [Acidobacteria bacterium]|nr:sensor histidine kinase [Acidobacteriota bacterium]